VCTQKKNLTAALVQNFFKSCFRAIDDAEFVLRMETRKGTWTGSTTSLHLHFDKPKPNKKLAEFTRPSV